MSYACPRQLEDVKKLGQSIMFDNGAFSFFNSGVKVDFNGYYAWVEKNLNKHLDFAVIPDIIDGTESENDVLLNQWPLGCCGAPVWHLHESFKRLHNLSTRGYKRICFGSSGKYWEIGSQLWMERIDTAFNLLCKNGGQPPVAVHMLRGMKTTSMSYPFASVDSTNFARNHNRYVTLEEKIEFIQRIDAVNCPMIWHHTDKVQKEAFNKSFCVYDSDEDYGVSLFNEFIKR